MKAEFKDLPEISPGFLYMVSDRCFRLDGHGHQLRFEPGVPVPVFRGLQAQAIAHGAKTLDGKKAAIIEDPTPTVKTDPSSDKYRADVQAAAELLLASNTPEDFGGNGKPYATAWERELGWRPVAMVRDEIWDYVKSAHVRSQ